MDVLLTSLADYGMMAIVVAVLMWQNNKITQRLFKVIEDNTEALVTLKGIIEAKVERRKD